MNIKKLLRQKLSTKLRVYQTEGVRFIAEDCDFRGLILDDMGLGKTIQGIGLAALKYPSSGHIICVVPKSNLYHWKREFKKHAGITAEVLEGRKPYKPQRKVIIINYEVLAWWVNYLTRLDPYMLILDECHYVKNMEAKRTIACDQLAQEVKAFVALSGTPVENAPAEFFPVLHMAKPRKFSSWNEYAWSFCDPKPGWRGMWDYTGASNLKKLHRITSKFSIRRLKKDVEKDLPKKQRIVIPVDIDNRKEYKHARDHFLNWLRTKEGASAVKRAQGAQALVRMGKLKQLAAHGKMDFVINWIENFLEETDQKLVVFAIHKPIIRELRRAFKHTAVFITGKTKPKDRLINVDRFVLDKRIRLAIGNLKAMGTGVDGFQKKCSKTLTIELGWNNTMHEQSEDRVLRIGQTSKSVENYYIVGKDTIEEWLLELNHMKQKNVDEILEGGRRKDRASLYKLMQKIAG